jgi:hypothetical protein
MAKEEILIDLKIDAEESNESINSLRASVREMTKARNEANLSTAEGRSRVNSLNQAIDANNAKIKSNIDALTKQKMNVGNYTDSILQAIPGLGKFSGGITGLNTAFKANPIGLVITALIALKGIFSQNAVVADKLSFIVEGFNKGLQSVIDSIVTTVSSLDNLKAAFLNPIDTITSFFNKTKQAAVAGYEAAEAADAFGAAQARANQEIKIADIQITSLEKSLKDRTKSEQERIAIANKIADMEIANSDRRAKIAADELANEQLRLKGKTLSGEEETRLVELQTSVLEANEEKKIAASSRTTRVNILLAKEESAAKKEIATRDQEEEAALDAINREKENQKSIDKLARIANENAQIIALNEDLNIQLEAESVEMDARQEAELQKSIERGRRQVAWQKLTEEQKLGIISGGLGQAAALFKKDTAEYKVLMTSRAIVDTYSAANLALKTFPPPIGAVFAGINIAAGLLNVAAIQGAKFAKGGLLKMYNNGGLLNGPSHANGGIPFSVGGMLGFEAEGGEAIINKRSTALFRPMLSAINRAGGGVAFEDGGVLGFPSSTISGATNSFFDLSRLEQTISNLKVQVAVTDINDGQKNYAEITDRAQF